MYGNKKYIKINLPEKDEGKRNKKDCHKKKSYCCSRGVTGDIGPTGATFFGNGSENIIGSTGASNPNIDVSVPINGDEWNNRQNGVRWIYQNNTWIQTPCCFEFLNDGSIIVTTMNNGLTGPSLIQPPPGITGCYQVFSDVFL